MTPLDTLRDDVRRIESQHEAGGNGDRMFGQLAAAVKWYIKQVSLAEQIETTVPPTLPASAVDETERYGGAIAKGANDDD